MAIEITMPQLGLTMTEGSVTQWLKQVGDQIKKGDEIVEIATDKINNIVEAHEAGELLAIVVQEGETVPVKTVLGIMGAHGEIVVSPENIGVVAEAIPVAAVVTGADSEAQGIDKPVKNQAVGGWVLASPLARKLATDKKINLEEVTGTGPAGRVVEKDIITYEEEVKIKISPTAAKMAADLHVNISDITSDGRVMKAHIMKAAGLSAAVIPPIDIAAPAAEPMAGIPLTGMRKVIAQRLTESWQTVPHVHHTVEVNMTKATALRNQFKAMDRKFSFTDLIIKALCRVLEEYPKQNDSLLGGINYLHNEHINIGVAVAVENGLIVPVIRNANHLGLMAIHKEVGRLAGKAREGKLLPDEYTGGTFTISNLGMYGCDHFTPIINPPESGILGVCRTVEKPIVVNGAIVIAPMMTCVLGYDHRVVDGALAGQVTARLREQLENPLLLL